MTIDQGKLQALAGKMIGEIGAAANGVLLLIGDKLGLFRALRIHGPLTSQELAQKTGTNERYIREWLSAQTATGIVEYDPAKGRFFMSPEQIALAADEESAVFMGGGFESLAAVVAEPTMVRDDVAHVPRRQAPRDATRHLHAVEGARDARALDANKSAPRYICVGLAVIRI